MNVEKLLDNAACCSQNRGMLDDGVDRECVRLNVVNPMLKEIERLSTEHSEALDLLRESLQWITATYSEDRTEFWGKVHEYLERAEQGQKS